MHSERCDFAWSRQSFTYIWLSYTFTMPTLHSIYSCAVSDNFVLIVLKFYNILICYIYISELYFFVCICTNVCESGGVPVEVRGQLAEVSYLLPSWFLDIKLMSSGLVAITFTCWAISPGPLDYAMIVLLNAYRIIILISPCFVVSISGACMTTFIFYDENFIVTSIDVCLFVCFGFYWSRTAFSLALFPVLPCSLALDLPVADMVQDSAFSNLAKVVCSWMTLGSHCSSWSY